MGRALYKPTPTIVEAAKALYNNHTVEEITQSDSGKINLGKTAKFINEVIERSKSANEKSICFITGVPGAGKTLAGLNIASQRQCIHEDEHAVFLSGNGPLVEVLQEALARDIANKKVNGIKTSKKNALRRTKSFIQNIHHFRDDCLKSDKPPIEKVSIFDEAQRAWTKDKTSKFMKQKKGIVDFDQSEPSFLISCLDRHEDWAVIICLIGGGQEINDGEAGLPEWFRCLGDKFSDWKVYASSQLVDYEYHNGEDLEKLLGTASFHTINDLHLAVSVRSFRSEKLASFVKSILDLELKKSSDLYSQLEEQYPIKVTRNLSTAKSWLHKQSRGSERVRVVSSSGAIRLKPYGINVKFKIDPPVWFLNDKNDIRSSSFMEDVATEFDIQGLELDWVCLAWDADLRLVNGEWDYKNFSGTKWQNINNEVKKKYLKNAYRVLLTRARQGMIIFVPKGDSEDVTRFPEFYDELFLYLKQIGIEEIY